MTGFFKIKGEDKTVYGINVDFIKFIEEDKLGGLKFYLADNNAPIIVGGKMDDLVVFNFKQDKTKNVSTTKKD